MVVSTFLGAMPLGGTGQLMSAPLSHTASADFNGDNLPDFLISEEVRPLIAGAEGLLLISAKLTFT